MLKHNRTTKRIISTINLALEGKYNAKGYSAADFENAFLSLRLGSLKLLYGQNKTLGLPSERSLMRTELFQIPRFQMESGSLELYIRRFVIDNLERFVWSTPLGKRCLWALLLDDVNCTRRVRPDSHTSAVGGFESLLKN